MLQNSRSQGAVDDLKAFPNHRVVTDVEHLTAARLDQKTGAIDEPVPQCLNCLKRPDRSSFAIRGTPLCDAGLHGPHQVESNDAEHLPGAIGKAALRRQAIEQL